MGREEEWPSWKELGFISFVDRWAVSSLRVSPHLRCMASGGARAEELGSSIHGLIRDLPNVL